MYRVYRTLTLNAHQPVYLGLHTLLGLRKLGQVGRKTWPNSLVGQVVLDGVRQHKVAVGQTLHQCRRTQAVCSVVGEVALADGEKTLNRGHQLVVYPDTTHRVVYGRVNHHRVVILHAVNFVGQLAGINVGYLFVHVEEVAITLTNGIDAQAFDALREIEEHSKTRVVYAESLVATLLCGTRGHVARNQVAEGGIATFQVIVAIFFGNVRTAFLSCLQCLSIFNLLGHPDTAVVTQRLRHQREFRLLVAVYGNTSGMNLHVRRVGKVGTLAVTLYGGGAVTAHCVGREEVGVAISTGSNNHGVGRETF